MVNNLNGSDARQSATNVKILTRIMPAFPLPTRNHGGHG